VVPWYIKLGFRMACMRCQQMEKRGYVHWFPWIHTKIHHGSWR